MPSEIPTTQIYRDVASVITGLYFIIRTFPLYVDQTQPHTLLHTWLFDSAFKTWLYSNSPPTTNHVWGTITF